MVVDATWPITTKELGTRVNETIVLGESHRIACDPIKTWIVPEDCDPQGFKNALLRANFTPGELEHRDGFIRTLSRMTNSK